MSTPGALKQSELTSIGVGIDGLTAELANTPAAWFKKLERELVEEFGFGPQFRRTGAYRTRAVQNEINPGQFVSDHLTGEAIDIRNWQAYVDVNALLFFRILARNGFRNIQVNGQPFRSEPWHWVNVKTSPPPTALSDNVERKRRTWLG